MTDEVYFFGCWNESGHHLWDVRRGHVRNPERLRIPADTDLDGGPMFLPPERLGDGALTYLPACNVTILAWWGSPWDGRGKVNNAIVARGFHSDDEVWVAFERLYPSLAALSRPNVKARP